MGAFHFAERILVDPEFFRTLPKKEILSGMGEVAKYGLGFSRGLMDWLRGLPPFDKNTSKALFEDLAQRCLNLKSEVVSRDPWEKEGLRQTLNLGHSLAHALEAIAEKGNLSHGQAVGLGLRAELRSGRLPDEERKEGEAFLDHLGQSSSLDEFFARPPLFEELQVFFLRDKKAEDQWIHEPRIASLGVCLMEKIEALPHLRSLLSTL
jgi:3-dehydroquinate synthetase